MAAALFLPSADDTPSWTVRLAGVARYANFAMAVVAVAALAGWALGFSVLTHFGAGAPILPSEAAMLLAGAVALAALHGAGQGRAQHGAMVLAASFIATIATFSLLRRMGIAVDLGVLGLGDPLVISGSAASACAFLLFAAALAAAPAEGPRTEERVRGLALAVAAVGLAALVGPGLNALSPSIGVATLGLAPAAALGLVAGSLSLIALRPAPRLLQLLQEAGPGRLLLGRLLPVALVLPVLVGWLQSRGYPGDGVGAAGRDLAVVLALVGGAFVMLWAIELLGRQALGSSRDDTAALAAAPLEWLEATLASVDQAVITADRDGRVVLANSAAEALLGTPPGTAVGRLIGELVECEDEAGALIDCPFAAALAGQPLEGAAAEPVLRRPDGERRAIEVSARPIRAPDASLIGGVLVLREVGERRARDQAHRKAYAELDRRVEERTQALERANEALSESSALMETFAAGTPELIIAKDRAGRITLINPAALRALGLTREQAIGRSKVELYGESEETRHIYECDREVLETGRPVTVEEHLMTPAGQRSFLVTKSPLRDDHGRIFGLVGVATDITERKQAQQEMEQLLQDEHRLRGEAESANRAKDEFLAIVSHELRSPLNALKGWSHVLSGTADPDPVVVRRAVQAIKRNVEQQTRLIDDLLDTSRIVSGKLTLEKRPIDLVDVVQGALEQSRPAALAKKIDLRFNSEHAVLAVDGDPGRLQQAVINLLSNAIKFTADEGAIEIALARSGERVQLTVTDNGIGIDADFLPHVFERFSQADCSTTRRYWGLGIGLALVRHLVELHGGTVSAVSPGPGRGSTFSVELPAAERAIASVQPMAGEGHFHAGEALRGICVLLVDDDADARDALQFALAQAGADVYCFESGAALRHILAGNPLSAGPVVLVLDIAMPGEDGFSVLAQVRAMRNVPFMPAIAVTALTYFDRSHFERAGFQDCLGKPLDPQRLVKAIAAQVRDGRGEQRELAANAAAASP